MPRNDLSDLLEEAGKMFEQEKNLIELRSGQAIFVGDTHGDLAATKRIIERYPLSENKIVFLGDYVDRGPSSMENLNTLLQLKLRHPRNLFLLMGNHEGYKAIEFHPADFWDSLQGELRHRYATVLAKLPLVASAPNGILALHGALPDVEKLEDINSIEFGSSAWQQITWGDWQQREGRYLGDDAFTARPQFGQDWFEHIMGKLNKKVLIRSHQPDALEAMYGRRCLTIFTSSAYRSFVRKRSVAIADLNNKIETVDDLVIESI